MELKPHLRWIQHHQWDWVGYLQVVRGMKLIMDFKHNPFPYHHRNIAIGQIHDEDTCSLLFLTYTTNCLQFIRKLHQMERDKKKWGQAQVSQWQNWSVAKRYSGTLAKWHRGETGQWANNEAAWQMTSQACWHSSSSTLLLFLGLSFNWHQTIN